MSEEKSKLDKLRDGLLKAMRGRADYKYSLPVFGEGPSPCALMVIGEAPGREETRLGKPFVGRAGKFFIAILEEVLGVKRDAVYITNVLKIWPNIETKRLKTRKPHKHEEDFFIPYLKEEIKAVKPYAILAVGKTAYFAVAPDMPFTPGKWIEAGGIKIMPIYHPSYILRRQKRLEESTRELKRALEEVKKELDSIP
ncbi:MAG: uracil-DNA glycosylase [Deltaproteobacteria bacterium]|nr:uracil-DNA glycosylase [Deltaproteobacteria bacterium]